MSNEQLRKDILKILEQHRGKAKVISSTQIAKRVNIQEDDTHAKTRDLIRDILEGSGLPIGATGKGYYLIDNEKELNEYMKNLTQRIQGIEKRRETVDRNFHQSASGRKLG